jgi:hypothetical protein
LAPASISSRQTFGHGCSSTCTSAAPVSDVRIMLLKIALLCSPEPKTGLCHQIFKNYEKIKGLFSYCCPVIASIEDL